MSRRPLIPMLVVLVAALGAFLPAWAQSAEVKWMNDYQAAIKEAETKGLPLLLDFYMTECPPCKRMDQETFRDEKVAALINQRFVALKVNGEREPKLARALGIDSFPTYVLATPEKKIIGTFKGYKEAPEFTELLQRALAGCSNPDWMQSDYKLALKWIGNKEYARAISALNRIVEDNNDRPVQANAKKLLRELEEQGRERLTRAKELQDQGQNGEAIKILGETIGDFPGLMLGKEAAEMLAKLVQNPEVHTQQRTRLAQDLLRQARDFHRKKEYVLCFERCNQLKQHYGDLSEGQEAMQLYTELKNDPEWLQSACDNFADRLGEMYLLLAESLLKRGQPQQAKHWLERTIRAFPGSRQAESAQIRLEQLQGTPPTRPVNFQSPP